MFCKTSMANLLFFQRCWSAILADAPALDKSDADLLISTCGYRVPFFFFAVLRGGQSGARLPPLYPIFFCFRQLFFLVASSLSPILRHRDITVYWFFLWCYFPSFPLTVTGYRLKICQQSFLLPQSPQPPNQVYIVSMPGQTRVLSCYVRTTITTSVSWREARVGVRTRPCGQGLRFRSRWFGAVFFAACDPVSALLMLVSAG